MTKRTISDRWLKSQQVKAGDYWDKGFPGFGVRVSDTGRKTFVLAARYPGFDNPTRRALGVYSALTLEKAHTKARDWLELIRQGKDPEIEEERIRAAEQRKRENSFRAVAEDFIAEKLSKERKGKEVERDVRNHLIAAWNGNPITEITDDEIAGLIKVKARKAPAQARNLLGTIKRLFQWAIDQRTYGIKVSPAAQLKPAALCGEKIARDRLLKDEELFAFWRNARRLTYPYGPVYQLLALTGLRLNEVADAQWSEFDLAKQIWTVPASRMKGKNGKARDHAVPLTPDMLAILEKLPRFKSGEFLFSTTFGEKPVWMSTKIKDRLDELMLRTLKARVRARGDDPDKVRLEPWTNHDLRRAVRSGLSRERIEEHVREAVLAHVRTGIQKTYDVHDYLDEKREALELWAARFRSIVEPPPPNVVDLEKARVGA